MCALNAMDNRTRKLTKIWSTKCALNAMDNAFRTPPLLSVSLSTCALQNGSSEHSPLRTPTVTDASSPAPSPPATGSVATGGLAMMDREGGIPTNINNNMHVLGIIF